MPPRLPPPPLVGSRKSEPDETTPKALPILLISAALVFAVMLAFLILLFLAQDPRGKSSTGLGSQTSDGLVMGATGAEGDGQPSTPGTGSPQDVVSADSSTTQDTPDSQTGTSETEASLGDQVVLPIRRSKSRGNLSDKPLENAVNGRNPFEDAAGKDDVVFVIDCSSSMAGDPFSRVQRSLCDTIQRMDENRKFGVLFFHGDTVLGPYSDALYAASTRNKRDAINWIQSVQTQGGTDPRDALAKALELKPNRIVVLSDGEFEADMVNEITLLNHKRNQPIRIDCIGLNEQVRTLQELARRNVSGVYYQAR